MINAIARTAGAAMLAVGVSLSIGSVASAEPSPCHPGDTLTLVNSSLQAFDVNGNQFVCSHTQPQKTKTNNGSRIYDDRV